MSDFLTSFRRAELHLPKRPTFADGFDTFRPIGFSEGLQQAARPPRLEARQPLPKGAREAAATLDAPLEFMARDMDRIWSSSDHPLHKALQTLSVPGHEVAQILSHYTHTPYHAYDLAGQVHELFGFHEGPGRDMHIADPKAWVAGVAGFGAEVLFDPLTYVTFGEGSLAKAASQALKGSGRITSGIIPEVTAGRLGRETIPLAVKAMVAKGVPRDPAALRVLQEAHGSPEAFEQAIQGFRGRGVKQEAPFASLETLAQHHAALEAAVEHQMPATRFAGIRLGPSPFVGLGRAAEGILGKYVRQPSVTIGEAVAPEHVELLANFGLKPEHPVQYLEDVLAGLQGKRMGQGLMSSQDPRLGGSLASWTTDRYLQWFPTAERERAFNTLRAAYAGLAGAAERNPELRMRLQRNPALFPETIAGRNQAKYQEGVETLDAVAGTPTFRAMLSQPGVRGIVDPLTAAAERASRAHGMAQGFFVGRTERLAQVLDYFERARHSDSAANAVVRWYDAATRQVQATPAGLLKTLFEAQDELLGHGVSFANAVGRGVDHANMFDTARKTAGDIANWQRVLDSMRDQGGQAVTGLEAMGRLGMPVVQDLMNALHPDPAAFGRGFQSMLNHLQAELLRQGETRTAQEVILGMKPAIKLHLTELGEKLTAEQLAASHAFVDALDAEGIYRVTNVLNTLKAEMPAFESPRAALAKWGMEKVADHLRRFQEAETELFRRMAYPLENQMRAQQHIFLPHNEKGVIWRTFKTKVEPGIRAIYHRLGMNPRILDEIDRWHGEDNAAEWRTEKEAFERWHQEDVAEVVAAHEGRTDMATLAKVDELAPKVFDYPAKLRPEDPDGVHELAVQALRQVVPNPEALAAALVARYNTHHAAGMLEKSRLAGAHVTTMSNYFPRSYIGKQTRDFFKWLNKQPDDARVRALVGTRMDAEEARQFANAAEAEMMIGKFKKEWADARFGVEPDVMVDNSMVSRVANRYRQNFRYLNNWRLVDGLKGLLPGTWSDTPKFDYVPLDLFSKRSGLGRYYVQKELYDALKSHLSGFGDMSETEKIADGLWGWLKDIQNYLKRFNVSLSPIHIKNEHANAFIGGIDIAGAWARVARNFADAGWPKDWFSPVMPAVRAMRKDPLYEEALQYNLIRGGAYDKATPLHERMRELVQPAAAVQGLKRWVTQGVGPLNALTFEVMDNALRLAGLEQAKRTGLSGRDAAAWVDRAMIDYSMRSYSPSARRILSGLFEFPSWMVGNLAFHGPNIVQNPLRYAMVGHAVDALNRSTMASVPQDLPNALANAWAIPYNPPDSSGQQWLRPGFPFQSVLNLEKDFTREMVEGRPHAALLVLGKYFAGRTWDRIRAAGDIGRASLKKEEQKTLPQVVFGTEKKPGMVGEMFWATEPYRIPEFARVLFTDIHAVPEEYHKVRLPLPGADIQGWMLNLMTETR